MRFKIVSGAHNYFGLKLQHFEGILFPNLDVSLVEALQDPASFKDFNMTGPVLKSIDDFERLESWVKNINAISDISELVMLANAMELDMGRFENIKQQRVHMVESFWRKMGWVDPSQRSAFTLVDHARVELNIIRGMILPHEKISQLVLGIQFSEMADRIKTQYELLLKPEFAMLHDHLPEALNYLNDFLLLHDIGKFSGGEKDHEDRGANILPSIFSQKSSVMPVEVQPFFIEMTRYHMIPDQLLNAEKREQTQKLLVDLFSKSGSSLTMEAKTWLWQLWVLFRISERAHSPHFGIINDETMLSFQKMYRQGLPLIS